MSEKIKWVDEGIQSVAVDELPDPEGISGPADFKKIPIEQMTAGIQKLQEMMLVIEEGTGTNSDYWAEYDAQRGLSGVNSYKEIYDVFFKGDAIKVSFDGQKYDIVNGRHRIWLAKRLGIKHLPMSLTRKVEKNE